MWSNSATMSNSQTYNLHCQITDNRKFLLNISKFVSVFLHSHHALGVLYGTPVVLYGTPPGECVVCLLPDSVGSVGEVLEPSGMRSLVMGLL